MESQGVEQQQPQPQHNSSELAEANVQPVSQPSQFEKLLQDSLSYIDGLMLVTITDSDRSTLFREALTIFHEPGFEEALINKCYDAFDDIEKLHMGASKILTLFYGAMLVVQFRVGSCYGTIVCDVICNVGLLHSLINRIRKYLLMFEDMRKSSDANLPEF